MKKRNLLMAFIAVVCIYSNGSPGVNFWSSDSTLQLSNNSELRILQSNLPVAKGTIKQEDSSLITGFPIDFAKGTYSSGSLDLLLTALYDFDEFYGVTLNGGKSFDAQAGTFASRIAVSNQNNRLEGQPLFLNYNAIKLQDLNTTLTVGIQNTLTTSIQLNQGTLFLENDLQLGDDIVITSSGLIKCYGHRVTFGAKPIIFEPGTIEWSNFPVVELENNIQLNGRWTFSGQSVLKGKGSILDLSNGKIRIKGTEPLYISNIKLKGFGKGKFEFENNRAQVRLSNVEIEMDDNYTFTYGGIYVEGPSTIVTKNYMLNFDNESSLTVDGVALNYETLSVLDSNNIQPTRDADLNSKKVAFLNNGIIRRVKGVQVGPLVLNPTVAFDTVRISDDIDIAPTKEIIVVNDVTFNGSTNAINFAKSANPLITIQAGKTLNFTNVALRNFKFDYLNLEPGAKIIFDDKTRIELLDTQNLNTTYTFRGNTVIDGMGKQLTFGPYGGIELHSSVQFEDIILYGISGSKLSGWDDSSTMTFQRVTLYLDNDFTLTKGHFEVIDWLDVVGSATFNYNTNKQSIIWDHATMTFWGDSTFHYMPPVANRDLINFVDERSVFSLNGGTISSTTTGMRLLGGSLQLNNDCYMKNPGALADSEGIQLGDGIDATNDCIITFITGANFNTLSGRFVYNNVALE
ncbi:MAG: hypothetical protein WCS92_04640 [Candidatus Babeliales bacterium]|jgi:hypothetical protein